MSRNGIYERLWKGWEGDFDRPTRATAIRVLPWERVREEITSGHASDIIADLYAGELLILRGAFPAKFMREIRGKVIAWQVGRPSEFHKMVDGCPDFHRIIDHETGLKYAFRQCKHSTYFYRWNADPLGIYEFIDARWRVLKVLMGLDSHEYERNRCSDGVVDRIQVVRYPPGAGYLEPHADPHAHQRVFISGYMGKRGLDYKGGGFYMVDERDQKLDVESHIEAGDIAIGYATVVHGVAPCEGVCDWTKPDGRWFLSLYSNATDHVPNRATGSPVRLSVPDTLPAGVA